MKGREIKGRLSQNAPGRRISLRLRGIPGGKAPKPTRDPGRSAREPGADRRAKIVIGLYVDDKILPQLQIQFKTSLQGGREFMEMIKGILKPT